MKFKVVLSEDNIITPGGLATAGALMNKTSLYRQLDAIPSGPRGEARIRNSDVVGAMVGINCQGKSSYAAVNEFTEEEDYYCGLLGTNSIPSEETLRQRFDQIAERITPILENAPAELLARAGAKPTPCFKGYVPLDVDVTPFDNSGTKKEGVSWTYKHLHGYAPIIANLGNEGYAIGAELRPGKQHSQNGTPEFMKKAIANARKVTDGKILVRQDSGFDSADNIKLYLKEQVDFIVKRNLRAVEAPEDWLDIALESISDEDPSTTVTEPREGKTVYVGSDAGAVNGHGEPIRIVYEVTVRTSKADGQLLIAPEVEAATFWVSLDHGQASNAEIIGLYRAHATSEQFHSELKTDMDIERFPSGRFKTNAALLLVGIYAYNILRIMGQESVKGGDAPHRKPVKRRRIRTVIQNLITIAVRVTRHARKVFLKLGRGNAWRHTYMRVHGALSG